MVGQEVGEGTRWAMSETDGALFSGFTGQVIGIKGGAALPVTMATPSTFGLHISETGSSHSSLPDPPHSPSPA